MSMKNNLFDDFVNKQFDGYRPDVPSHIWENIARKQEKEKPGGFWLFFTKARIVGLLSLLLLVGTATYFYSNNKGDKNNVAKNNIKTIPQNYNNETVTPTNTNDVFTRESPPNQNQISSAKEDTASVNIIGPSTILNNNTSPESSNTEEEVKRRRTKSNEDYQAYLNKYSHKGEVKAESVEPNAASRNLLVNKKSKIENRNTIVPIKINDETIDNFSKKRYTKAKTRANIKQADIDVEENEILLSEKNIQYILRNNILVLTSIQSDFVFSPTIKLLPLKAAGPIPCPKFDDGEISNVKYWDVYAGPDYIYRSMQDLTNSAYAEKRKASTAIHYAYSAGLRFTKVFNNKISIRTGINYSQINERFVAFNGYTLERIININANGDTTANYFNSNAQYKTSENVYRNIDIPLQLGYEFGNNRLRINIGAGAMLNIATKRKGSVLDNNGKPVSISSGNDTSSLYGFKKTTGVSLIGSASIYYKLNNRLYLMAEPYYRYSMSPFTKPGISFTQRFHTGGLKLGFRWDF
jgi:hypothetical protein